MRGASPSGSRAETSRKFEDKRIKCTIICRFACFFTFFCLRTRANYKRLFPGPLNTPASREIIISCIYSPPSKPCPPPYHQNPLQRRTVRNERNQTLPKTPPTTNSTLNQDHRSQVRQVGVQHCRVHYPATQLFFALSTFYHLQSVALAVLAKIQLLQRRQLL